LVLLLLACIISLLISLAAARGSHGFPDAGNINVTLTNKTIPPEPVLVYYNFVQSILRLEWAQIGTAAQKANYTMQLQIWSGSPKPWTTIYSGTATVASIVINEPWLSIEARFRYQASAGSSVTQWSKIRNIRLDCIVDKRKCKKPFVS